MRPVVENSELRKLNQRHLADELQHSRVGWGHLTTLNRRNKDVLKSYVPMLLLLLPSACCEGPEQDFEDLVPHGYFTPRLLRAAHDEALREVVLPGLDYLGWGQTA